VNGPLRMVIRTPHEIILDADVRAARVPSETGQVGLRPRQERFVLVVEPGLVILRSQDGTRFAATAGGLLQVDRQRCVLYTPFAVLGSDEAEVLAALDRAVAVPNGELSARRALGALEQRIVTEIRQRSPLARASADHE
jgi:F0F1-type ATP synthase epsilon subunit